MLRSRSLSVALVAVAFLATAGAEETKGAKSKEPPAELAKILERFDKDPEPQREMEKVYASALWYLVERDVDGYLSCFHEDFAIHEGTSCIRVPPEAMRKRLEENFQKVPRSTQKLVDLVDLSKVKVYSRAQARATLDEWKKEPPLIAGVMKDEDYLVIAPTRVANASAGEAEVFYVVRKDASGRWKIVLGE